MSHRFAAAVVLAVSLSLTSFAGDPAGSFSPTNTPVSPSGSRAIVDLPTSQHMRNVGSNVDGLGLCVFTSIQHAARWANLVDLDGFRKWMESKPGGGWPQKVDQMIAAYCRQKGVAVPGYVQHTGGDDAFLDLAIRTGRCPSVTYSGMDDFYHQGIDHMVTLAHIDSTSAAIIDNNRPGSWLWMTRSEFLTRWRARGGGWAIVFLAPPPTVYGSSPIAHQCECGGQGACQCGDDCQCEPVAKVGQLFKQFPSNQCPNGQCQNGQCAPSRIVTGPTGSTPLATSEGTWWQLNGRLYITNPTNGVYDPMTRQFARLDPNTLTYGAWGPVPDDLKIPYVAGAGDFLPTGVVPSKIHDHPQYSISGQPCSKEEAFGVLLSDDSDRWHLAVVGDPSFLKKVRADLDALSPAIAAKLHVQTYLPAAWQVAQFHLPAVGVTLRRPAGPSGRVSSDVGTIAAADYSSARLEALLTDPAGPAPAPPKPAPTPDPKPAPTPAPGPVSPTPPAPSSEPATPAQPSLPSIPLEYVAAGGLLILVLRRK